MLPEEEELEIGEEGRGEWVFKWCLGSLFASTKSGDVCPIDCVRACFGQIAFQDLSIILVSLSDGFVVPDLPLAVAKLVGSSSHDNVTVWGRGGFFFRKSSSRGGWPDEIHVVEKKLSTLLVTIETVTMLVD